MKMNELLSTLVLSHMSCYAVALHCDIVRSCVTDELTSGL